MTIVFRNPGVIDVTSITAFGVSSKEGSGAIGFFGTGLKYALAILLRHGCEVKLFCGERELNFDVESVRVRNHDFDFVRMNGERLGFTTELGKTWELWAAFRELYCNCVDEKGDVFLLDEGESMPLQPHETVVCVNGQNFREVWEDRDSIILNTTPVVKAAPANAHAGVSSFLFYRGVRAAKLDKPSVYTYNIQRRLELTEDRTIKYPWEPNNAICRLWATSTDERAIEAVLTARKGTYERDLDFNGYEPGETFLSVVENLHARFHPDLNQSAWKNCEPFLRDRLLEAPPAQLDPLDAKRLSKAVAFCEQIGFPVSKYPIVVTSALGPDVLGMAYRERIFLSLRAFHAGTKMLAGTLIEEFLHLDSSHGDMTRELQNLLIDRICSLGERVVGEPL